MKAVKKTAEYTVFQKRSGRYAVKGENGTINGEEKAKILLAEGLIKLSVAAEPEVEEVAEAADGSSEEAAE